MSFSHLRSVFAVSFLAASGSALFGQAPPLGVHPRPAASDYAVSQQTSSATFAASLVPRAEVKRLFAVDITNTYVVLEVACYPTSSASIAISPDDFLVKSGSASDFVHPADAVTIAAVMQDKNTPRRASTGSTTVAATAGIGYESETDPYTGRRIHGTYTEVGTGVGVGGPDAGPPMPPPPGSTSYDRMTLEQQLAQRALPSGSFSAPVAGFVYFPAREIKKKNGTYELEYLTSGSGTVRLQVPGKSR